MMAVAPVFARLVGQDEAVATLSAAVAAAAATVRTGVLDPTPSAVSWACTADASGDSAAAVATRASAMTHAWLFTGPPGSGRSVAARAFAAALQCAAGGCGHCAECHTTLAGTHADVRAVVPEGLSISVEEMRGLVLRAAGAPSGGRWQVVLIEDADRLTEKASNALLKAVEEPSPRTVFLLCTPSMHPDDVSVTIRSRCRVVTLRTPSAESIADMLVREDGVDPTTAAWSAAASQGHVGRARRLARDPQARSRREAVLAIPRRLTGIGACFDAAASLIAATDAEAAGDASDSDARERSELERALGAGGTGKGAAGAVRGAAGILKELERKQKSRTTRSKRDALDRALVDLAGFYRDVLTVQLGSGVAPVHADATHDTSAAARAWPPEGSLRRLEAVLACRDAIEANVKPQIAIEAMMVTLWRG